MYTKKSLFLYTEKKRIVIIYNKRLESFCYIYRRFRRTLVYIEKKRRKAVI